MAWASPSRTIVAAVAVGLGVVSWLLGLLLGRGPTALAAGGRYLLLLAVAGGILAVFERGLSWTALLGLYLGQVAALAAVAFLPHEVSAAEPWGWQPLFVLSATLAAGLGAALTAALLGGASTTGTTR